MEYCNICVFLINFIYGLNRVVYDIIIFDELIICIDNFYIELYIKNLNENVVEVVVNIILRRNVIVNRFIGFIMFLN